MKDHKTLQQRIDELEGDPVIHIGAASAFFFIGTKSEYERDIDAISFKYLGEAKKELEGMQQILDAFPKKLAELRKLCRKTENPERIKKLAEVARAVSSYAYKIPFVNSEITKKRKYVEKFIPFRDRKAAEPYARFQDDGIVILVSGKEHAPYWFREEYLTGDIQYNGDDEDEEELTDE